MPNIIKSFNYSQRSKTIQRNRKFFPICFYGGIIFQILQLLNIVIQNPLSFLETVIIVIYFVLCCKSYLCKSALNSYTIYESLLIFID